MKKIYCGMVLMSVAYSAHGMLLMNSLKHSGVGGRRVTNRSNRIPAIAQQRSFATYNNATNLSQPKTIKISEKCYQDWQDIGHDATILKYYLQGTCDGVGGIGKVDVKPSAVLQWLCEESDMNDATELKHMSATGYMYSFITDEQYIQFDTAFTEKYNELHDVPATWNWFHGHFMQYMQTEIEKYGKDMMERDAAKVVLAEQGVHFKGNGRTIIFDGATMSEDPEDMQKVREALDTLYKK